MAMPSWQLDNKPERESGRRRSLSRSKYTLIRPNGDDSLLGTACLSQ